MSFKSVMIVEDDRDIRGLLHELIEGEGYLVDTAANGREALELLKRPGFRPGIIFLDLAMPVMDGPAFLLEVAKDPNLKGLEIMAMTANAAPSVSGVVGWMKKPVDIELVMEIVTLYCSA